MLRGSESAQTFALLLLFSGVTERMNAAQKERIKSIAERVLKTFGACYLRAYKIIAIRDAKAARAAKKEENSSEEEPKRT